MNKKILNVLLCATVATSLCGCSFDFGKVTAESLIDGVGKASETTKTADFSVELSADIPFTYESMTSHVKLKLSADAQMDEDTTYMSGDVTAEVFGMETTEKLKTYAQIEDDIITTYTYDEESDSWTYSDKDYEEEDSFLNIDSSMFENLTLEKADNEYIVTGETSLNDGFKMDELLTALNEEDSEIDKVNATLTFDKKTKQIKKMEISTDEDEEIELSLTITYNTIGEDMDVSVPSRVLRNAVKETEETEDDTAINGYEDEETGYDDAYTYDDSDYEYDDSWYSQTEESDDSSYSYDDSDYDYDYSYDSEEDVDTITSYSSEETLAEELFGTNDIHTSDVATLTSGFLDENDYYNTRIYSFLTLYGREEFLDYVSLWDYTTDDTKLTMVYVEAITDSVSVKDMVDAGANEAEINEILSQIQTR